MKRLFYITLIVISSAVTFTACTEEEIAPTLESTDNTGGNVQEPIKK